MIIAKSVFTPPIIDHHLGLGLGLARKDKDLLDTIGEVDADLGVALLLVLPQAVLLQVDEAVPPGDVL